MLVKKIKFLKSLFYTLRQFLFETKKGSIVLIAIGILGLLVVISCDYQDYVSKKMPFILLMYFVIGGICKFFLMDIFEGKEPKKPKLWVEILDWAVSIWNWISIGMIFYISYIILKLR